MNNESVHFMVFWTVFLIVCVLVSAAAHRYIKSAVGSNLLAAVVVAAILFCADTIHLGYFDGWLIIAAPIAATVAIFVSALVGLFMDRRSLSNRIRNSPHGP
jgi:hypothetical protein